MSEPKKVYKLWISIEEISLDENGVEQYRDMHEEDTRSVGVFKDIDEAVGHMDMLGEHYQHVGDGQTDTGFNFE